MPNSILVDSGPLIALFDKDDNYHASILSFIKGKRFKFPTTTAVLTEVTHMLDFDVRAQVDFLEWIIKGGITLIDVTSGDIARIIQLTRQYADLPMDFADASLVVAAEKTGIRRIISIDSDFEIYRLPGKVKIENVFRS